MTRNQRRIKKAAEEKALTYISAEYIGGDSPNWLDKGLWETEFFYHGATIFLVGKNVGEIIHQINNINTMSLPR